MWCDFSDCVTFSTENTKMCISVILVFLHTFKCGQHGWNVLFIHLISSCCHVVTSMTVYISAPNINMFIAI